MHIKGIFRTKIRRLAFLNSFLVIFLLCSSSPDFPFLGRTTNTSFRSLCLFSLDIHQFARLSAKTSCPNLVLTNSIAEAPLSKQTPIERQHSLLHHLPSSQALKAALLPPSAMMDSFTQRDPARTPSLARYSTSSGESAKHNSTVTASKQNVASSARPWSA